MDKGNLGDKGERTSSCQWRDSHAASSPAVAEQVAEGKAEVEAVVAPGRPCTAKVAHLRWEGDLALNPKQVRAAGARILPLGADCDRIA